MPEDATRAQSSGLLGRNSCFQTILISNNKSSEAIHLWPTYIDLGGPDAKYGPREREGERGGGGREWSGAISSSLPWSYIRGTVLFPQIPQTEGQTGEPKTTNPKLMSGYCPVHFSSLVWLHKVFMSRASRHNVPREGGEDGGKGGGMGVLVRRVDWLTISARFPIELDHQAYSNDSLFPPITIKHTAVTTRRKPSPAKPHPPRGGPASTADKFYPWVGQRGQRLPKATGTRWPRYKMSRQ